MGNVTKVNVLKVNLKYIFRLVLRHLKIQLKNEQIEKLANAENGNIEWVLWQVKNQIEEAIKNGQFRPSSRCASSTSRSVTNSRGKNLSQKNNIY